MGMGKVLAVMGAIGGGVVLADAYMHGWVPFWQRITPQPTARATPIRKPTEMDIAKLRERQAYAEALKNTKYTVSRSP